MPAIADPPKATQDAKIVVPNVSSRLVYWFNWYLKRYIPKHFHAFAISGTGGLQKIRTDQRLIVYMNHASWWDPLMALTLARIYFPDRKLFAPIDAKAVQKYPFMQKLGFFPVEQERLHGAGHFLKSARTILNQPGTSVWLTPEGQFADPRETDLPFQPGLAHLVSKLDSGIVLPLAMEYPFWEERNPEALGRFGEPIFIERFAELGKSQWQEILEKRLRDTQRELAKISRERNSGALEVLLSGNAGVDWMYDLLRRVRSVLTGRRLEESHSDKLQ